MLDIMEGKGASIVEDSVHIPEYLIAWSIIRNVPASMRGTPFSKIL